MSDPARSIRPKSIAHTKELLRERIRALVVQFGAIADGPRAFDPGVTVVPTSGKVAGAAEMGLMVEAALDAWLTTGRFNEEFESQLGKTDRHQARDDGQLRFVGQAGGVFNVHLSQACGPCDHARRRGDRGGRGNWNYRISGELTHTDRVMHDTFWIGVFPGLTHEMLDYIVEKLEQFLGVGF